MSRAVCMKWVLIFVHVRVGESGKMNRTENVVVGAIAQGVGCLLCSQANPGWTLIHSLESHMAPARRDLRTEAVVTPEHPWEWPKPLPPKNKEENVGVEEYVNKLWRGVLTVSPKCFSKKIFKDRENQVAVGEDKEK